MIERTQNHQEIGPDAIATEEEILSIFEKLVGGKDFVETRKLDDEAGVYLWDIEIPNDDGKTEYSFRRGRVEEGQLPGIRVDVAYYDAEGFPISGHSVAKRIERIWHLTP